MARRHRNPSRGAIIFGVVAGVVTLGAIVYAVVERRRFKQLAEAILPENLRLPRPDFAVRLPTEPDDYAVLSEVVCECTNEWVAPGQQIEDVEPLLVEIQRCSANKIMPDFPWPPVSGDHATVHTLWGALGYEAARHLTLSLCPASPPALKGGGR